MNELIRFETFQLVSFVLASSLFIYMLIAFFTWFIKECKPRKLKRGGKYAMRF